MPTATHPTDEPIQRTLQSWARHASESDQTNPTTDPDHRKHFFRSVMEQQRRINQANKATQATAGAALLVALPMVGC